MDWIKALKNIFDTVQMANIFDDQKYFADCTPLYPIEDIKRAFEGISHDSGELRKFVDEYFDQPKPYQPKETAQSDIQEHIKHLWSALTDTQQNDSGSQIGVPHPYILPGGRFREFYYWDSYFTMLGLNIDGKHDLIRSMVGNFAYLIERYGFIPNGTRTYFLSRSQPPFFSLMVELLATIDGDQVYLTYRDALAKEYAYWMDEDHQSSSQEGHVVCLDDGMIANRYYDHSNSPRSESYREDVELYKTSKNKHSIHREIKSACESGWDFSSRWMTDTNDLSTTVTTQIIPVDLNCLLYHLECTLSKAHQLADDAEQSEKYIRQSEKRKAMIQTLCWNEEQGYYHDYNIHTGSQTEVKSLAGLFPLLFRLSSANQADRALGVIKDHFLKEGGLLTTLIASGQQWDAPNAWAPLQYVGYQAAKNYEHNDLAFEIIDRWTQNVERVYNNTGKLMEKYNATDATSIAGGGEYPNQDGFGWTNGVYQYFIKETFLNNHIKHLI